jgi:hypothetical protein
MNRVAQMNRSEFVSLKFYYNFHFLHVSVGCVLIVASPSKKKKSLTFPSGPNSKVRGFDGIHRSAAATHYHEHQQRLLPSCTTYTITQIHLPILLKLKTEVNK